MGYEKAKGRRKSPTFVMLLNYIIDSPAWQSLSPKSQALWLHIRRRYNGHNNGEIALSCREASDKLNVSKNTASKAFDELIDRGFIKIGEYAGFTNKHRRSTRWIITDVEYNNSKPTNEWRSYQG